MIDGRIELSAVLLLIGDRVAVVDFRGIKPASYPALVELFSFYPSNQYPNTTLKLFSRFLTYQIYIHHVSLHLQLLLRRVQLLRLLHLHCMSLLTHSGSYKHHHLEWDTTLGQEIN